mmetsp:Transcript_133257/g.234882  ORF Transcript_133257/g.234882 Transcript_133257/m.234882 type:complete len:233 (-) Transcript_133257:77-775(-)
MLFGDVQEEEEELELNPRKPPKSIPVNQVGLVPSMIVGTAPLPKSLRGVFWLSDMEDGSCLMSFGGPNGDGAGCSQGRMNEYNEILIWLDGDRVWSSGTAPDEKDTQDKLLLMYQFTFDDAEEPTRADIEAIGNWEGIKEDVMNYGLGGGSIMFLPNQQHWMELAEDDPEWPNSVVWIRKSGACCIPMYSYKVVQVLDENSNRIEPTFSKFVEYMTNGPGKASKGMMNFRSD